MKEKVKLLEIGGAWYFRPQTLQECAEDFLIFLERLKRIDDRFSIWYEGGFSRKEAMQHKALYTYEYIKNKMCKKCDDSDYPEYTFQAGFWNGAKKESLSMGINVSIGGEARVGWNVCILRLPYEGEIFEDYSKKENYQKLQELFIDHWNPEKIMDQDGKWVAL